MTTMTGRVKAESADAHLQWVRDYHGDAALARLLAAVPVDTSAEWIAFEELIELDLAIERLFGRGVRHFQRELGRYSAHLSLAAARPARADDLHRFFRCTAVLNARSYRQTSLKSGEMTHAAEPFFNSVYCQSAIGWYEQVIIEHGATPFLVTERSCQCAGDAACTFELAWE